MVDVRMEEEGENNVLLIFLSGRFEDDDCDRFREQVSERISKCRRLAISLAGVEYLSKQAFMSLQLISQMVAGRQGALVLFGVPPQLRQHFEKQVSMIFATRDQTVKYLKAV